MEETKFWKIIGNLFNKEDLFRGDIKKCQKTQAKGMIKSVL